MRTGRSFYITLLGGQRKNSSTWDNARREYKLTSLGKTFYANAVEKYIVLWPVRILLTRVTGITFERDDFMTSTAVSLGKIEVPRALLPHVEPLHRQFADTGRASRALTQGLSLYAGLRDKAIDINPRVQGTGQQLIHLGC